jgi:hypothetical protein
LGGNDFFRVRTCQKFAERRGDRGPEVDCSGSFITGLYLIPSDLQGRGARRQPGRHQQGRLPGAILLPRHPLEEHRGAARREEQEHERGGGDLGERAVPPGPAGEPPRQRLAIGRDRQVGEVVLDVAGQFERGFSCTSNFGAWAGSVARTIAGRRS